MEGETLMLRYRRRKRSEEVRLDWCDQKKEETSVEEKALGMKTDLVWRVFLRSPIEAGCRRLSPGTLGESLGPASALFMSAGTS